MPPEMPLLWVLRDVLNLTGSHYGCGVGSCGSLMVESPLSEPDRVIKVGGSVVSDVNLTL